MRILFRTLCLLLLCSLIGCDSSKKVIYLQNAVEKGACPIDSSYDLRIRKDDNLSIIVNCKEPALAAPFNMQLTSQAFTGSQTVSSGYSTGTPQGFLVDSKGEIDYPMLGKLKVEGMTRMQVADAIKEYLVSNGYITDPVVNVRLLNFRVSVLGEVQRPGQLKVESERISVLDALSQAGDLTIYGRTNLILLRRP